MAYKDPAKQTAKTAAMRDTVRTWLHEYLKLTPCIDCGESNPVVLEFDHQRDKKFGIGSAASRGGSLNTVIREVAKCEVRCANCHRMKTYKERGHTHKG